MTRAWIDAIAMVLFCAGFAVLLGKAVIGELGPRDPADEVADERAARLDAMAAEFEAQQEAAGDQR